MLQISAELLAMSSDAAILLKNNRVVFANMEAQSLLGQDCVGKTVRSLFGSDLPASQAGSFISEILLNGVRYIIRKKTIDNVSAIFLTGIEHNESMVNDAFVFTLRNCLMNIDVALNLLRLKLDEYPELSESISVICHDSFKLNRVMTNVSILLNNRKDPLIRTEHIDLSRFLRDLVDSVSLLCTGQEIKYKGPEELKMWVDASMLESLMLNLISNCIIHAVGCTRISIHLSKTKSGCMIAVDDDGCGIDIDDIQKSFTRYKYSFDVDQINRGPGLGLSAARYVAYMHGGTLLMESQPGRGTAVRVSLSSCPQHKDKAKQKAPFQPSMKNLLSGLAYCLPSKFYTERYID